jgi:hydrogenase maturation protease
MSRWHEENCGVDPSRFSVLVLGLGNPLRRDDGVGPRVIRELEGRGLPEGVAALDGGTGGLDLLQVIEGWERVVIVDAADLSRGSGGFAVGRAAPGRLAPGQFIRFTPDEAHLVGTAEHFSFHHAGLAEVLALARALDRPLPSIVVFGVQPEDVGWGEGLSPDVEAGLPDLIDAVLEEVRR